MNRKYDRQLKFEAVRMFQEEGSTGTDVDQPPGIGQRMVSRWKRQLTLVIGLTLAAATATSGFSQPAKDDANRRVDSLVAQMTLAEKVGQMTQLSLKAVSGRRGTATETHRLDPTRLRDVLVNHHVGSILSVYSVAFTLERWHEVISRIQDVATRETRLGIPVMYAIDAIHGANYTREATLFPQSLAMAATRNPELIRRCSGITAYEVRASGIPWSFYPVLGVGRQPLWPRLFETFGEDPYLCGVMGAASIEGLEGADNNISAPGKVAACMKHFVGYSAPLSGKDRTPAWIPERMLRDIFLPPFERAVEAGVHTLMANSGEINGIPVHSSHYLLTDVLRGELGFHGLVVSDWEDINHLYTRDHVAASRREAVRMAVMAGVDMSMVPYDFSFCEDLVALARSGEVPMWRIDEAVRRILRVKMELGLFENPYPDAEMAANVGSAESAAVSLQAAREALTLLKNDNHVLPLDRGGRVLVTGPAANLRAPLNGGWTYIWQGNVEALYPTAQPTILEAVQASIGAENVTYLPGTDFERAIDIPAAVEVSRGVDAAIVCIGEAAYCEMRGNIHDLTLPQAQLDLATAIQETGTPVVLVLVEGRPRVITPAVERAGAIVMAYLPGPQGGQAIADVLFGDFNPCGRLPVTYPRNPNDLVCYDYRPLEVDIAGKLNPLWFFGHGLSYTTFTYSDLKLSSQKLGAGDLLTVSVAVANVGDRPGMEAVELYLSDLVRSVSPPVRQLKRFAKIELAPGETRTVEFTLSIDDLSFHGRDNRCTAEPGEFTVTIDRLSDGFALVAAGDGGLE